MTWLRRATLAALAAFVLPAGAWVAPAEASFPGQNGLIVWSRVFVHTDPEIWSLDLTTGQKLPLTANDRNDFEPAWSADGRMIAYASSTADDVDVYVARADGSNERNLSQHPGTADRWPAWAPDGHRLVFTRQNFDGTGGIWVMRSDGTHQIELVPDDTANERPVWSPDGTTIAFASNRSGNYDLWSIAPDGSNLVQLTDTPEVQEENPNWSPDGTLLAFDSCRSPTYPCPGFSPNYEIFTIDVAGGGVQRLSNAAGIDFHPAWAPDGTKIVFRSDRLGYTAIWMMDADGGNPVVLTPRQFTGGVDPDWQPLP